MSEKPPTRFPEFRQRAQDLVEQPTRVKALAAQASRKLSRTSGDKFREFRDQLGTAIEMIRAWLSGDYRELSNKTLVVLVAALLYFVVPFDAIPDFLFGWGLIDDVAVLSYVFSQLREEVDAFRAWQDKE